MTGILIRKEKIILYGKKKKNKRKKGKKRKKGTILAKKKDNTLKNMWKLRKEKRIINCKGQRVISMRKKVKKIMEGNRRKKGELYYFRYGIEAKYGTRQCNRLRIEINA